MDITQTLDDWLKEAEFAENIAYRQLTPPRQALFEPFPATIHPALKRTLNAKGITALYSHQAKAISLLESGENIVISTGTSSGKSLCYGIPIINQQLNQPGATSLLLFPTKALTNDQYNNFADYAEQLPGGNIKPAIYDGDTPNHQRSAMRKSATILMTNPDMLHQGILPHHTSWARFFSNLRFVVIDEMHIYRGVFGSHFANLMRRLKRICAFYNAYPQFVLTSATIGNPEELAASLIEQKVHLIDEDGSPKGPAHFMVYNPPLVDEKLGIRKSSIDFGVTFAQKLTHANHQSLVFARTRRTVEMLLTYLRHRLPIQEQNAVRGYRSGYLKSERREIEQGLKSGSVRAVFSTSALELGVDIGDLDAVILVGFPGTIATARQRIGRAGRKQQPSLGIMIATNEAMDQYLAAHPEYLVDRNPEQALIDPQNLVILLQHIGCAAFELPFSRSEGFGSMNPEELARFLDLLEQSGSLTRQGEEYYWLADRYPAAEVSLRSSTPNVVSLNVVEENNE
ncbi:MAG: DEAD/DEAH box helicase, partial [Anaerolineaceae bacterium]|nr:DEAD/DEAH box helicase [Anaerolineaceae bacterium]